MPGLFVEAGASIQCPHGGRVVVAPTQARVRAGRPIGLLSGAYPVVGCPFLVPAGPAMKPQPCVRVQWTMPALRVRVAGQPVLVRSSVGLCLSAEQVPQGSAVIVVTQIRAKGA